MNQETVILVCVVFITLYLVIRMFLTLIGRQDCCRGIFKGGQTYASYTEELEPGVMLQVLTLPNKKCPSCGHYKCIFKNITWDTSVTPARLDEVDFSCNDCGWEGSYI